MDKNKGKVKTVYSTALPYPEIAWPTVSSEHEAAILSLLAPCLQQIGDYSRAQLPSSRKRKRGKKARDNQTQKEVSAHQGNAEPNSSHVSIGFNSTIRKLEDFVSSPKSVTPALRQDHKAQPSCGNCARPDVVFVCRAAIPAPASLSIPILVAAASSRTGASEPIRLVQLSVSAEASISAALGLPRVSVLALDDGASAAGPLLRYIRSQVEPVDVPWLTQVPSPVYVPVSVESREVVVGSKQTSRRGKADSDKR